MSARTKKDSAFVVAKNREARLTDISVENSLLLVELSYDLSSVQSQRVSGVAGRRKGERTLDQRPPRNPTLCTLPQSSPEQASTAQRTSDYRSLCVFKANSVSDEGTK